MPGVFQQACTDEVVAVAGVPLVKTQLQALIVPFVDVDASTNV